MLYNLLKSVLFLLDPEKVHHLTVKALKRLNRNRPGRWFLRLLGAGPAIHDPVEVAGLKFKNRVGLAAGFDKDARYMAPLSYMGFGFLEVGTVTPKPQEGNSRPRLFRLPKDKALINRMGFNNEGLEGMLERLRRRSKEVVLGINIGVNKENVSQDKALEDYSILFRRLHDYADYFTVNVSSPNTSGLRDLQEKSFLDTLLQHLQNLNTSRESERPIFLKIAPDLDKPDLDSILEAALNAGISGIIATNTTISRVGLRSDAERVNAIGNGGLSGLPLKVRSTEVIRYIREKVGPDFPIIGVGGIMTAQDAIEKLEAGANLVQIYTGFIYEGPQLIRNCATALRSATNKT